MIDPTKGPFSFSGGLDGAGEAPGTDDIDPQDPAQKLAPGKLGEPIAQGAPDECAAFQKSPLAELLGERLPSAPQKGQPGLGGYAGSIGKLKVPLSSIEPGIENRCAVDMSGRFRIDQLVEDRDIRCASDVSGRCIGDLPVEDRDNRCASDVSGRCIGDLPQENRDNRCASDVSGRCIGDQPVEERDNRCAIDASGRCGIDTSGS